MKDMSQIPVNVKLVIDHTINIANTESKINTIQFDLANKVTIGGPLCTPNAKVIPFFIGYSPNATVKCWRL
jgi:hypothetical protein